MLSVLQEKWIECLKKGKEINLIHTSLGIMRQTEYDELIKSRAIKELFITKELNKFLGDYIYRECVITRDYPILSITTSRGTEYCDEGGNLTILEERMKEMRKRSPTAVLEIEYYPRAYTQYYDLKRESYKPLQNKVMENVIDVFGLKNFNV